MRYKEKFEDYIPETEWVSDNRFYHEKMLDRIWGRIMKRYPKHNNYWDEIYEKVKDDYLSNYDFEVKVIIKKKVKD